MMTSISNNAVQTPEQQLSIMRIVYAQWLSLAMLVVWFLFTYAVISWGKTLLYPIFNQSSVDIIAQSLLFALAGACIGFFEWLILREWITQKWVWILISTLVLSTLLTLGTSQYTRFSVHIPDDYVYIPFRIQTVLGSTMFRQNTLLGSVAGLVCGLAFGVAQSFLLTYRRLHWCLVSAINWMIVWVGYAALEAYVYYAIAGIGYH